MKKVLLVSPYFPPSSVAGVHRVRILANHLRQYGWEPTVLCVHERFHEQRLDHDLEKLVDCTVRIIKTKAWPTRLSRFFRIGDLSIRGYQYMKSAIAELADNRQLDLLFISVLPGFSSRLGPWFKKKYGLPYIVDYQDPWLQSGYEQVRSGSKLWLAQKIALHSEPAVVACADHITSVSGGTNDLIKSRYPELKDEKFSAIPIGVDVNDFNAATFDCNSYDWCNQNRDVVKICYVGNVWAQGRHTLRLLFKAIRVIRAEWEKEGIKVCLVFVGSSNQVVENAEEIVKPLAAEEMIDDLVYEVPERVDYLHAIGMMKVSDINLIIGSNTPHYTASKLYPLLVAGKPVFGLIHEKSSVCAVSGMAGGVRLVTFNSQSKDADIVSRTVLGLRDVMHEKQSMEKPDLDAIRDYQGQGIARQFSEIFNQVTATYSG